MRCLILGGLLIIAIQTTAFASQYGEFPAPVDYPVQRSVLTPRHVTISPYVEPFRVRVYSTPPQQPFYNVPPYAIITPY